MDKQQSERVRRTRIMTKSGNTRRFTKNGTKKTICKTPGRDEMKFDIGKFAKLAMKNSKQHLMDGTELPIKTKLVRWEDKKTYKYSGIFEADTIKQEGMKKIRKEYSWKTRKLLEIKL